ncbi:glucokinase [Motiliproteus sp. MSK22-1]|uniref:glucokinase n=1 Tax=Motiliproteus sp. MSK22-1 TaxID=1897630 RepID=UPI0009753F20|nr:glucokinase [Motiliproteus sp. MSK22-1]OMH25713.1 glucokinase [Motiliproteus sp. MSK22-1]
MTTSVLADQSTYSLIADIGGTNARFAVVKEGGFLPLHIRNLKVSDYPDIETAIQSYLQAEPELGQRTPARACLAIACPVTRDVVDMTNSGWVFSKSALKESLGLEQLEIINDYAALSYAASQLSADALYQVGSGSALAGQPLALLGPGTGLGVGGLIRHGGRLVPVVTEGGHVDFAPSNELEVEILRYLWTRYSHVSVERLLSGMGLSNLFAALSSIKGQHPDQQSSPIEPAEITRRALDQKDPLCLEVLECFCSILGSVAGSMALNLGAQGGVYITGGIIPRMLEFFSASGFRQRFEDKGRFKAYMTAIPTYVVTAEQPGLTGAAVALSELNG